MEEHHNTNLGPKLNYRERTCSPVDEEPCTQLTSRQQQTTRLNELY